LLKQLMLLVLIATCGNAYAADWPLPVPTATASLQAQQAPEGVGVPRVINGTPTADFPAVAALVIRDASGEALCSGTLVSPSVILTAAHCVAGGATAIRAFFLPNDDTENAYDAVAYAINPEFDFPFADLSMVLLEAPVAGIAPAPLASRKPRRRKLGTIVGYGEDEVGNVGLKEMGTVRLAKCPKRFPALGLARGALARSVCWRAHPGQQDTCHGDSGGPLLIEGSVAGVTSGGDPNCSGVLSWDTSVAAFIPWISDLPYLLLCPEPGADGWWTSRPRSSGC
jgi:hypothetical protein